MKNLCLGFALCVPLLLSSGCASQMSAILDEQQTEAEGFASFINQDSVTQLKVQGTALFHVSPAFQIGPKLDFERVSGLGVTANAAFIGGEVRYNMKTEGDLLPFVGGSLSFVTASGDAAGISLSETGSAFTLNGGVRVPVSPGGFLVTKLQYNNYSVGLLDTDNFGVFAGYSVRY